MNRSAHSKPNIAALAERFAPESQSDRNDQARSPVSDTKCRPAAANEGLNRPIKRLIWALVGVAFLPTAILCVLLWHGSRPGTPSSAGLAHRVQGPSGLEIALSSADKIEATAGQEIDFALAIDATGALPARCIIAVSGMPDGASFSDGRPYGATGWSLRPDEIGELRLRLPAARSGASDLRIELLSADGAVLAQSESRLNITAETVSVAESNPFKQIARADAPKSDETLPPMPQRKPVLAANAKPSVKVRSVKVVTIKPPGPTRPHDGAYALGEAAEAPAEWVEIVRPVDMHARPQQTSETVKVMEKGVKLRVTARDKNWVRVGDPATSTNGWIYSRFLKPTEPPAQ